MENHIKSDGTSVCAAGHTKQHGLDQLSRKIHMDAMPEVGPAVVQSKV